MHQLGSGQSSQPLPYDPNTVEKFCQDNGGPAIFTEIVKMTTPTRTNRICTTKQETDARNEAVVVETVQLDAERYGSVSPLTWLK